jgi:hypothetical protein
MFLIASANSTGGAIAGTPNTSTTVTISSLDSVNTPDLPAAGVSVGDTYKIISCDTLSSIFGSPESTGVFGAGNSTASDNVLLVFNGSSSTYFYSTTSNRWSRVAPGFPDATNTAIPPYYGVQYLRLPATPVSLTFTGGVPTNQRELSIKNSGTTYLSQFYPSDVTLSALGLQNLPGWSSDSSSSASDNVVLVSGGSSSTYWFNGTSWKRVAPGFPDSDSVVIPAGASINIIKKGTATGYAEFIQPLPYSL